MAHTALKYDIDELGQPIGFPVSDWRAANTPGQAVLTGSYCRCEPLSLAKHSEPLYHANRTDAEHRIWTYLPYGPFVGLAEYQAWMSASCFNGDPFFYAIIDPDTDKALGVASYLRINPDAGSIEVGHINFSPLLQNTIMASEAMFLMMQNAFAMGYRRYEWKCNALNEKSCNAAKRLGFTFEGVFRQMMVVKGRNRDSAWFSILDREWPDLEKAFKIWLDPQNFNDSGQQIQALSALTRQALTG